MRNIDSNNNAATNAARKLLLSEYNSVLSTHSLDVPGYPFGSVAPYSLDASGNMIILISSIAQHTKNIVADNKISLIVTESDVANVHTAGRLTLMGEASLIDADDEDTKERYYRFFPESRQYHTQHNFAFYRLSAVKARYIGGFGKIHWIDTQELLLPHSFSGEEETSMVEHMNLDHQKAIDTYCKNYQVPMQNSNDQEKLLETLPKTVGIDCLGVSIRVEEKIYRVPFDKIAKDSLEVRQRLVSMANQESPIVANL